MLFGLPLLIEKQNGCHNRKGHVYLWVWLTFLCLLKWWNCWGSCWWVARYEEDIWCTAFIPMRSWPSPGAWDLDPEQRGSWLQEPCDWSLVNVVDSAQNLGTLVVPQLNGSQVDRGQSIAKIIPLNRIVYWRGGEWSHTQGVHNLLFSWATGTQHLLHIKPESD